MALTAQEEELFQAALAVLPSWFQDDKRVFEGLQSYAKIIGQGRAQIDFWVSQTFIDQAVGPTGAEPDWLNSHARDRGTFRQENETDPALRVRIKSVADSLIRSALLAQAQAIIDAEAISGTVVMVELRRDKAFFLDTGSDSGTGGVFVGTAPNMEFTPTVDFARPPFKPITLEEATTFQVTFSGASSPSNNGTFKIIGLLLDAALYSNAGGVASVDAGVAWSIQRFDRDGNLLSGFKDSYFSRGDRFGSERATIILILPFGCTEATRLSVVEAMRQKRGAGVLAIVECRTIP